jgi:ABC-2 type transport system permease protein
MPGARTSTCHQACASTATTTTAASVSGGSAVATAGLTNSPEHAQVTTLPVSLGVIAVASWVGISGTGELTLVKRLLPGGSATELVLNAWNGGVALGDSLLLLAPTAAWVVVAGALAARLFRWEPRR